MCPFLFLSFSLFSSLPYFLLLFCFYIFHFLVFPFLLLFTLFTSQLSCPFCSFILLSLCWLHYTLFSSYRFPFFRCLVFYLLLAPLSFLILLLIWLSWSPLISSFLCSAPYLPVSHISFSLPFVIHCLCMLTFMSHPFPYLPLSALITLHFVILLLSFFRCIVFYLLISPLSFVVPPFILLSLTLFTSYVSTYFLISLLHSAIIFSVISSLTDSFYPCFTTVPELVNVINVISR